MRFDSPGWLLAAVVLVPLAILTLALRARRVRRDLDRYGDPSLTAQWSERPSRARRFAANAVLVAGLALVMLALARPQWGESAAAVRRSSRDVLFVLDLSRSMNARDGSPTRLDAARAAARAIADSLPGDRVGLLVFGGNAFLQLPLTSDHGIFSRFLDAASTEDVPDPASDLEGALDLAGATYVRDGGPGAHVAVLLSDGESTEGDIAAAARALDSAGVRLYAIGVGTAAGATVPNTPSDPRPHRDFAGRIVISRLDAGQLRAAAAAAGGTYTTFSGAASVKPVVDAVRRLRSAVTTSRERGALTDRFVWPVALALVALLVEAILIAPRREGRQHSARHLAGIARAAAVLLVVAGSLAARPQWNRSRVARASALYEAGKFRDALAELRTALGEARAAGDVDGVAFVQYDLGNTLYRLAQFDDAMRSYRSALGGSLPIRRQALFNLGNVYMHLADAEPDKRPTLHAAINSYTEALALDSRDVDAKWNLELALRRLADEETRFGGGPHRRADWGGGNLTKAGYAGAPQTGAGAAQGGGFGNPQGGESAPKISESQARQMLDAIEKAMVTGQAGGASRGTEATSTRADW